MTVADLTTEDIAFLVLTIENMAESEAAEYNKTFDTEAEAVEWAISGCPGQLAAYRKVKALLGYVP